MVTYIDAAGAEMKLATTVSQHAGGIPAGTLRAIELDPEPPLGEGMAAMNEGAYRVVVTREAGHWPADLPGLAGAHTYALMRGACRRWTRRCGRSWCWPLTCRMRLCRPGAGVRLSRW